MDFRSSLRYDAESPIDSTLGVRYLDVFGDLEAVRTYKRQSLDLLRLVPGDRLLEAGCGSGADLAEALRRVEPSGLVCAVDVNRAMLAAAKSALTGLASPPRLALGSAGRLPWPEAVFDACRADRVLQHLHRPLEAVAEMARVVRSGGRVLLCDADWGTVVVAASDRRTTRRVLEKFCDEIPSGWAGRRLCGWLAEADLEVEIVEPYTLTFRSLDEADQALGLKGAALSAAESGAVSLEAAADWMMELEACDAQGRFLASVTGFAALGVKRS